LANFITIPFEMMQLCALLKTVGPTTTRTTQGVYTNLIKQISGRFQQGF